MAQLWVNLPAKDKSAPPAYQTILNAQIPIVELGNGSRLRVVAGAYGAAKGPARTFSDLHVWDVALKAGADIVLPVATGDNVMVAHFAGTLHVAAQDLPQPGLLMFGPQGEGIALQAKSDVKLLVLAGKPLNEPISHYGPFVMNTEAEIKQAIADFRAGKMGSPDDFDA